MNNENKRPMPEADAMKPVIQRDDDSVTMHFNEETIQSRMLVDDPTALDLAYSRVMMAFVMLRSQPSSILMIGLGGGSLPKYCHRHFPQAQITVVEINPEVIAARDTFLVPPDDERFKVVCGDGAALVASAQPGAYDVILVDGFGPDGQQPEELCSIAFYKACRAALRESGVLMVNLQDLEPQCSRLIGRVWQVFGEPVVPLEVECGGNLVVLASDEAAFRACAEGFRRRWAELEPVHKETLEGIDLALKEELKPWLPMVSDKPKPRPKPKVDVKPEAKAAVKPTAKPMAKPAVKPSLGKTMAKHGGKHKVKPKAKPAR